MRVRLRITGIIAMYNFRFRVINFLPLKRQRRRRNCLHNYNRWLHFDKFSSTVRGAPITHCS